MKLKILSIIFLIACIHGLSEAQAIFSINYQYGTQSDTTIYKTFLLVNNTESGLARIKFKDPASENDITVDLITTQDYFINENGAEDTTTLLISATSSTFKSAESSNAFQSPVFVFKLNIANGFYEPVGICPSGSDPELIPLTHFSAELKKDSTLNKQFVLSFFKKTEELYKSLFAPRTRGDYSAGKDMKLYIIAVADTRDTVIGKACKIDLDRTIETFDTIRKQLGVKQYIQTKIFGKNLSKKNVENAISKLKPGADDIVVFYYSGHGFKPEEGERLYPNIKLKTFHKNRKDVYENSINMETIYHLINDKGARFNLVFSDCCNDEIETVNSTGSKPANVRGSSIEWNEKNLSDLFLTKTKTSILLSSAKSGQRAMSKDGFGSFFTFYFKTTMETYASRAKSNVSWNDIIIASQKEIVAKSKKTWCGKPVICNQSPVYVINVNN